MLMNAIPPRDDSQQTYRPSLARQAAAIVFTAVITLVASTVAVSAFVYGALGIRRTGVCVAIVLIVAALVVAGAAWRILARTPSRVVVGDRTLLVRIAGRDEVWAQTGSWPGTAPTFTAVTSATSPSSPRTLRTLGVSDAGGRVEFDCRSFSPAVFADLASAVRVFAPTPPAPSVPAPGQPRLPGPSKGTSWPVI
jgi:hypothetical protein